MNLRHLAMSLLVLITAAILVGCGSGDGAVDTADAGTPKSVPMSEGGGTPNAGQKGGVAPPGI